MFWQRKAVRIAGGSGISYEMVPYGDTDVRMPVTCDCYDVPEDYDERFDELVVLPAWEEIPESERAD